jgi:hypothetical protein
MNKSILTAPAWKLFLAFVAGTLASVLIAFATAKYFNWNVYYGPHPTLRYALITMILWSYPYLVGRELIRKTRPAAVLYEDRQMALIVFLALVNNIFIVYYTENYGLLWPVILLSMSVNIFCMIKVFSFPARELKSIKLNRRARSSEIWLEVILFVFWPLSVWWLQPTLQSIGAAKEQR